MASEAASLGTTEEAGPGEGWVMVDGAQTVL